MTAARIRDAAKILRVCYLPVMAGHEDWHDVPDLAERLADLLERMADSIGVVEHLFDPAELELPEYVALLALVDQLEGAAR